jgi:hypothetical protein
MGNSVSEAAHPTQGEVKSMKRVSVEDEAAREAILTAGSQTHPCPKKHDVHFTAQELRREIRKGTTGGFKKHCPLCDTDYLALVQRGEVDGRQTITVIALQHYPR